MVMIERLMSQHITALVDPAHGGTIQHIGRDSNPTQNVLAWYEWGDIQPLPLEYVEGESEKHWLSRYKGGWQFLTPNAGPECVHNGQRHSCHGESSYLPWTVAKRSNESLIMELHLFESLYLKRSFSLHKSKPIFHCETEIKNNSLTPQEVVMVEHIAFQGSSMIQVSAPKKSMWIFCKDYEEDDLGTMFWDESGIDRPDLRYPIEGKFERMTYLDDGNEGWISIYDQTRKVGARLKWERESFPYLWYWQERFSPRFPFYGRGEITALEPASCYPGEALIGASKFGRTTVILPGAEISFVTDLEIF
jgi:hypothetical protein